MSKEVEIDLLKPNRCVISCLGTPWWLGVNLWVAERWGGGILEGCAVTHVASCGEVEH